MASKDNETSEEFCSTMESASIHGYRSIGIAMGFDLGLFDVLATFSEPKTISEISATAGMKERYVREWLGAMVIARIIDLDDTGEKYSLPAHRVPYLTRSGKHNVMALQCSLLANLTKNAFDKVKESFQTDGPSGTSYADYPGKADLTAKFTEPWLKNHLASAFISLFPDLKVQLEKGITVIDIGCGMGVSTCALAEAFPNSTFYGVDFLDVNINTAKQQVEQNKLHNCKFFVEDVLKLPEEWASRFQYAFMNNVLHDLAHPLVCLTEIKRVLSPRGLMTVNDVNSHMSVADNLKGAPSLEFFYMTSLLVCMPQSLGSGGLGLGSCCGVEKLSEILTSAGFEILSSDVTPGSNSMSHYFYCKMV